jgi:hypothetical protein
VNATSIAFWTDAPEEAFDLLGLKIHKINIKKIEDTIKNPHPCLFHQDEQYFVRDIFYIDLKIFFFYNLVKNNFRKKQSFLLFLLKDQNAIMEFFCSLLNYFANNVFPNLKIGGNHHQTQYRYST